MADTQKLKEFLIGLGFKIDAPTEKKFHDSIERATKTALGMSVGLQATALAITAATVKIASDFDKLYYASQKTNSSVKNIKGFDYAIRQLGGTSEGALQSLGNLASFIRSNPASLKFIENQLGVRTTDNGKLRDTVDIVQDIAAAFERMPFWQAKVYGNFLGMDDDTIIALTRGLGKFREQYDGLIRSTGVDQEKVALQSMQFMQQVRTLVEGLGLLKDKVFADLLDKYGPKLQEFTEYLATHLPEISQDIGDAVDKLIMFGSEVNSIAQQLGGWEQVGKGILLFFAGTWAAGMLAAIGPVGAAILAIIGGIAYLKGVQSGAIDKTPETEKLSNGWDLFTGGGKGSLAGLGWKKLQEYASTHGVRANQAARGKSVGSGTADEGLTRMVDVLMQWAGKGNDSVSEIVKAWSPKKGENNAEHIASISKQLGVSPDDWLDMSHPDVLASIMRAMLVDKEGTNRFAGTNAIEQATYARLGWDSPGSGASVSQTTEININGAGDPAAVGREVAGHQGRVNQDMARNLGSNVR